MNISRLSLRAHNNHLEFPTFNPQWNAEHKLGDMKERVILRGLAVEKCGFSGKREPLTKSWIEKNTEYRIYN